MADGKKPQHLRGRLLWTAAVVGLAVVALAAWDGWQWYTTPAPPTVPLDGLDPAAAAAIAAAQQNVRWHGRSAAAWGDYGKTLRANGFDPASDLCFAQAERLDPTEPRWPYYQGLSLIRRDPEAAVVFLRRAVERADRRDPANHTPRLVLIETLLQTEAYEAAAKELDWLGDFANARVQYDWALLAVAQGNDAAATRCFTACLDSPFARQKSYAALAALHLRQGDAAGAAEFSRQAAAPPADQQWDDRYVVEYLILESGRRGRMAQAVDLEKEGRLQEALSILRGLAEDPSDAPAQIAMGQVLQRLGRLEEAERSFRKAADGKTEEAQASNLLAGVLCAEGAQLRERFSDKAEGKFREAESYVDRALALEPDFAMAHLSRGLILNALGRKNEAIQSLRQATLLRPEMAAPHLALGQALAEDDQKAEAVVELQHACDLAPPGDSRPSDLLAQVRGDKPK